MKLQYDQVKIGLQYNTSLVNVIFGSRFFISKIFEETIHSAKINDTSNGLPVSLRKFCNNLSV